MGAIQSSVNSLVNTATVAAGLYSVSPAGKRAAETQNIRAQEKGLEKARTSISANEKLSPEQRAAATEEIAQKQADLAERKFYNQPSEKTATNYGRRNEFVAEAVTDELPEFGTSPQEQAEIRAKQSADNAIRAKTKQKRDFMSYLQSQPTSLGGKVGDLPEALQKTIAAQYTKSQRKSMMDKIDRGDR